ncbi:hypothetical protein C7444_105184 [Sphaerotilus hippei]|uniref:Uncharacterized protein n=1 Tax=Sphaerotilus hippei TaxID=744406 RepID=A0A318H1U1_9BURK|nr:DUF6776 family protein [Sphaerotilus hippei]PXW97084.1 hypothetical protein C7444_105184 [Sphaerotilus hippei]
MRWKLLRRRFSVSAPRVTVRSRLPWPLRWLSLALVFGFSAAVALWAFEFGKEIAGVDRNAVKELARVTEELEQMRQVHERALTVSNSADSLLRAGRVAQESLAARVKALEAENLALMRDVAFLEKVAPGGGGSRLVSVRGLQAQLEASGRVHFQALLMQQQGRSTEFTGRAEIVLTGTLDGKNWSQPDRQATQIKLKPYQRLEGAIDFPPKAVLKQLDVKILDQNGKTVVTESVRL